MTKLAVLDDLVLRYQQLKYHNNPALKKRLQDVQQWQKNRLCKAHQQFFSQKNHELMGHYFVQRLYGGPDFDLIAEQVSRLIQHAHKIERLIPSTAIQTGTHGIELSILAVQLDEEVAEELLKHYDLQTPLNNSMMQQCYIQVKQEKERLKQLEMTDKLGCYLDSHLRSFMLQTAFKMGKPLAYKHRFDTLYRFMHEGFIALKPLNSAANFVKTFTNKERQVIEKLHTGHPSPFA